MFLHIYLVCPGSGFVSLHTVLCPTFIIRIRIRITSHYWCAGAVPAGHLAQQGGDPGRGEQVRHTRHVQGTQCIILHHLLAQSCTLTINF